MILAIDVGGTKTLVASFTLKGERTEEIRFESPQEYPAYIALLETTVKQLKTKTFKRCTVAFPGRVDREAGVVVALGNRPWKNVPIRADIQKFMDIPVIVENDAKLAGLAEALLLPDYRKVLYLTVSTGIGGAFIVGGKIDPNTHDAEYGHMLLEHDGKLARWEHFASGKAIYKKHNQRVSDITDPSILYEIARNIAIGLVDVIAAVTPDAVVLGGGVGVNFPKFGEKLISELKIYENDLVPIPPVFGCQLAEDSVIYGCYDLAMQMQDA